MIGIVFFWGMCIRENNRKDYSEEDCSEEDDSKELETMKKVANSRR